MNEEKKHRITMTDRELRLLAGVLHNLLEWAGHDDRPDHGLAKLMFLRNPRFESYNEIKDNLLSVYGRMFRLAYPWRCIRTGRGARKT